MTSKKQKLILMTSLAFILTLFAATMLRAGGLDTRFAVLAWGFILIFGCMSFVRGIFAINRCK